MKMTTISSISPTFPNRDIERMERFIEKVAKNGQGVLEILLKKEDLSPPQAISELDFALGS